MKHDQTIDAHKLMHWMNVRKVTPAMVSKTSGVAVDVLNDILNDENRALSDDQAAKLADTLNVEISALNANTDAPEAVIHMSREDIEATCRAVHRDGIHFYNYYNLPAPKGQVAPVILDILCPADRLPAQNHGHLEPAITINLGPGHINGLWGDELNEHTWHPLHANTGGDETWVIGDSYVEPSYCPHTYSRVGGEAAQILSYTVRSNLEPLLGNANQWSDDAHDRLIDAVDAGGFAGSALGEYMARRGHDSRSLAAAAEIGGNALAAFIEGDGDALGIDELRAVGIVLGVDYRLFMEPRHRNDPIGKTCCSVADSLASIRSFKSYTVASMALSSRLPDLVGLFMKVDKPETDETLDLAEFSATHYLVTGGAPTFRWTDGDGSIQSRALGTGDCLWVGPYVAHGFAGAGALIKMGNGEGMTYLDHMELSNTFALAATLRRGRRDRSGWGYDEPETAE